MLLLNTLNYKRVFYDQFNCSSDINIFMRVVRLWACDHIINPMFFTISHIVHDCFYSWPANSLFLILLPNSFLKTTVMSLNNSDLTLDCQCCSFREWGWAKIELNKRKQILENQKKRVCLLFLYDFCRPRKNL